MEVFNSPIGVSRNVALPSVAGDLPRASNILPGHTLIRPDMDSLRSAVKFPKKELEDGARVYGNIKSIGVNVGNNKRIVNTPFRRSNDDGFKKPWRTYDQVNRRDVNDENYLNFKSELIPNQKQYRPFHRWPPLESNEKSEYTIHYKNIHSDQMKPNRKVPLFLPESKGHAPMQETPFHLPEEHVSMLEKHFYLPEVHVPMQEKPFFLPERHAPTPKIPSKAIGKKIKNVLLFGTMVMDDNDENMMASSTFFRNARRDYDDIESKEHAPILKQLNLPLRWEYIIVLTDDSPAKKKKGGSIVEDDETNRNNIESPKILAKFPNAREHSPLWKDGKVLRAGVHKPKPIPVAINPEVEDEKKYYEPPQKLVDFLNSRDLFDHVKISDRAPTLEELVPISHPEEYNIRKWWFFNQDDYKPFLN